MGKKVNLTGQRFGRLTALEETDQRQSGSIIWKCRCDCGETAFVPAMSLRNGRTRSCGCIQKEVAVKRLGVQKYYTDGTCVKALLQAPGSRNSSGVVGVSYVKDDDTWHAYINFKHHRYNLGRRKRIEDAIALRKEAEQRIHGEFLAWYYSQHPDQKPKGQT